MGGALLRRLHTYYGVAKPGIILGNLLTAAAGFALGARDGIDLLSLAATLMGLALIIASASVLNNYGDRAADAKMVRTRGRALVVGTISAPEALRLAALLAMVGTCILLYWTSLLVASIALLGLVVYVALYSPLKYRSVHATLVGSVAGSIPPLVGYSAAHGEVDRLALLLFLVVALWQLPHFFSIAIRRLDDYKLASIPVLPVKRGLFATQCQMAFYVTTFAVAAPAIAWIDCAGLFYFIGSSLAGLAWLALCVWGMVFKTEPKVWAKQMFFCSLAVILTLCSLLIFDSST